MRIAIVDDNEEDRKYLTKEITEIFSEKTKRKSSNYTAFKW